MVVGMSAVRWGSNLGFRLCFLFYFLCFLLYFFFFGFRNLFLFNCFFYIFGRFFNFDQSFFLFSFRFLLGFFNFLFFFYYLGYFFFSLTIFACVCLSVFSNIFLTWVASLTELIGFFGNDLFGFLVDISLYFCRCVFDSLVLLLFKVVYFRLNLLLRFFGIRFQFINKSIFILFYHLVRSLIYLLGFFVFCFSSLPWFDLASSCKFLFLSKRSKVRLKVKISYRAVLAGSGLGQHVLSNAFLQERMVLDGGGLGSKAKGN